MSLYPLKGKWSLKKKFCQKILSLGIPPGTPATHADWWPGGLSPASQQKEQEGTREPEARGHRGEGEGGRRGTRPDPVGIKDPRADSREGTDGGGGGGGGRGRGELGGKWGQCNWTTIKKKQKKKRGKIMAIARISKWPSPDKQQDTADFRPITIGTVLCQRIWKSLKKKIHSSLNLPGRNTVLLTP